MKFKPANFNWATSMPQFMTGGYAKTTLPITTASMPKYWTHLEALRKPPSSRLSPAEERGRIRRLC